MWRAEDTRLGRQVAIKVLRGDRDEDEDLRKRFEREARTIASLSHPHICALFDVGEHDGRHYLVMECLEGVSLAERLMRGPMPPAEAIEIAGQIAAALAAAHEQGIVHRDLKPANVILTRSGAKLLDFGLARLHAASHNLAVSLEAVATASMELPGRLIGTLPYMAPEQIQGRNADQRSDLWAFGAVLFEMVTGRRAFSGDTSTAVVAGILHGEPPAVSSVGFDAPPILDRLVRECLAKDPLRRWQSAADAAAALGWIGADVAAPDAVPRRSFRKIVLRLGGLAAAVILGLAISRVVAPPAAPDQPLRFVIQPPVGYTLADILIGTGIAVAPDGGTIAFVARGDGPPFLWVWSLEDGSAFQIEDTVGAASPFWSPDGRSIAFFAGGTLRRVDLTGGPAREVCDAPFGAVGIWMSGDRIVFSQWAGEHAGLYVVPANGGGSAVLPGSLMDEHGLFRTWPTALPDGRHYLFLKGGYRGTVAEPEVCIGSVDSSDEQCLGRSDSRVGFVAPDLLLFVHAGTLLAQRVDLRSAALIGSPVIVAADPWWFSPSGAAEFSASANGRTLVVRRDPGPSQLLWFDRGGRMVGTLGDEARYFWPRLSPDGRSLAVRVRDPESGVGDIWLLSTATGIANRLTFEPSDTQSPTWFPDGRSLAFGASRAGPPDIFVRDLETGVEGNLIALPGTQFPRDLSSDGRFLVYEDYSPSRRMSSQIWLLPLTGGDPPRLVSSAPASQFSPRFSPDARVIALVSEESGRPEVYVMPVDQPGPKIRVSAAGGTLPRWKADGSELYFLARDGLVMAVDARHRPQLEVGVARPLFRAPGSGPSVDFDVDAAGQRFLFTVPVTEGGDSLSVALGWQAAVRGGAVQPRAGS